MIAPPLKFICFPTASRLRRESGYRDHDADVVHDMRGADNERAAAHIAEWDIDVLVDLNGYSFPSRLPLLMRRPAKQLVAWFNMFATSGMRAFDWIVGDAAVIPSREEPHYCEKVHRLPGTYTAFEVLYPVPEVAPPPCLAADGAIRFGYLGSHYKLTDAGHRQLGGDPAARAASRACSSRPRRSMTARRRPICARDSRRSASMRLACASPEAASISISSAHTAKSTSRSIRFPTAAARRRWRRYGRECRC